jgi:hypothetical protein
MQGAWHIPLEISLPCGGKKRVQHLVAYAARAQ